jgi:hypothetical protein
MSTQCTDGIDFIGVRNIESLIAASNKALLERLKEQQIAFSRTIPVSAIDAELAALNHKEESA